MSFNIITPAEMKENIAQQTKELRLRQQLTQEGLAKRSGVSLGTLKKFERTGDISLETFLKLAFTLGFIDHFKKLVAASSYEEGVSLDNLIQRTKRRCRGKIK